MVNNGYKRRQLFVDPEVQGALVLKTALYWVMCVVAIALMLLCWRIVTGPARMFHTHFEDMWFQFGPALLASFVVLPLVIYDILRMSNRFCGPLFRLRRSLRALARGEHVDPISFRDGDFWPEIAQEFNALLACLQRDVPLSEPHVADESTGQRVA
jgi:hypothetical protein